VSKYFIILSLFLSSFSIQASNLIDDERITEQKNCFRSQFTTYDSWRGFMEGKRKKRIKSPEKLFKAMSFFDAMFGEDKFNKYLMNLSCSTFKYQVGDKEVHGYIIKPKFTGKKLPVLIYNRGGNGNYGSVVFGSMMHNLFPIANQGFIIIGSQYRGTITGNHLLDEFGGKDVKDVTSLFDYIPSIKGSDPKRVGMYGASRGSMQTFLALKELNKIKAVASIAGVSDLLKRLEDRPEMEKVYKNRIPGYNENKIEELAKRSVLTWVDELSPNVPILLLHGTKDKRVSVNNSIDLADALSKNNIPHKLVVYQGDNHGLLKNKEKVNKELVHWFRKYL
jgi:dipeptidyl aminopeptidase/acylaminoacyl peptidase